MPSFLADPRFGDDPAPIDPETARETARDILSDPEYLEPEPTLVERAFEWVGERLGSFFGTLTGGGPGSLIGWIVLLALVAGAAWLIVRSMRVPGVARGAAGDDVRYGTETLWEADLWLTESERLAAAGDLPGALRCRHQALLARMVEEQVVDEMPGRTAAEYRDVLAARLPHVAQELADLTERFERTWYGGAPVGAAELEAYSASCRTVEAGVRERQQVGA